MKAIPIGGRGFDCNTNGEPFDRSGGMRRCTTQPPTKPASSAPYPQAAFHGDRRPA